MKNLSGLFTVEDNIDDVVEDSFLCGELFKILTPYLVHNNYKVRLHSFTVVSRLLSDSIHFLRDVESSLPNILFSLHTPEARIAELSKGCLHSIIDVIPVEKWFPYAENCIMKTKSNKTIVILLTIFGEFGSEIPLRNIIKFVDDPHSNIKALAFSILEKARAEEIESSLKKNKVSFKSYKRIQSIIDTKQISLPEPSTNTEVSSITSQSSRQSLLQGIPQSFQEDSPQDIQEGSLTDPRDDSSTDPRDDLLTDYKEEEEPQTTDESEEEDFGKKEDFSEEEDLKSYAPLGKIVRKKAEGMQYKLRNLSRYNWFERMTYLELLRENIEQNDNIVKDPLKVTDCVLSGTFPLNEKLKDLITDILTRLMSFYPEVIESYPKELIKFALITKSDYLSSLIAESDPAIIIKSVLNLKESCSTPLPYIQFIDFIMEQHTDTILPTQLLFRVLQYALETIKTKESVNVVKILCKNQGDETERFIRKQSIQSQKLLVPILLKNKKRAVPKQRTIKSGASQEELIVLISEELKKKNCNERLVIDAFLAIEDIDFKQLLKLFLKFLYITDTQEDLSGIISKHFNTPSVFVLLEDESITKSLLIGFSRMIWGCSPAVIDGAQKYYPFLYRLFSHGSSEIREAVVVISMAIEKATGASILSISDISQRHKELIEQIMSRYSIL